MTIIPPLRRAAAHRARTPIRQLRAWAPAEVCLGLWVLYELARPLDPIRRTLIIVLVVMAIGAFTIPIVADFFLLVIPPAGYFGGIAGIVAAACALIDVTLRAVKQRVPPATPSG